MMRECGVPVTEARRRYIRLFCILRKMYHRHHLMRDIATVMSTILEDYLRGNEYEVEGEVYETRLHWHLARMELEVIRNCTSSPFFRAIPERN